MTRSISSLASIRFVLITAALAAAPACQKSSEAPRPLLPAPADAPAASPALGTPARPAPRAEAKPTPQPPAPARLTPPARAAAADLEVHRLEVAKGVVDREPVTAAPIRAGKEKVYAFLDVANTSSAPAELVVTFERPGVATGNVTLTVPPHQSRWRTWAHSRGLRTPGEWTVRVRTTDGEDVMARRFVVEAAAGTAAAPAAATADIAAAAAAAAAAAPGAAAAAVPAAATADTAPAAAAANAGTAGTSDTQPTAPSSGA